MPSKRARQSRLTFSPLPSSSPATKGYNKQIQDRAAAVTLDSPAKRRKTVQNESAIDSIPTPAASLEQHVSPVAGDESDSEPVRATQRRLGSQRSIEGRQGLRQQQIDFSNARDPDSFSSPIRLASSPSRPQSSGRPGMFSSQRRQRALVESSEESEDELPSAKQLVTRSNSRKSKKGSDVRRTRSVAQPVAIADSDEEEIMVGGNRSTAIEVESEEEDEDMPTTMGTQRRKRQRRGSRNSFISSSPPRMAESDSDIEIIERPMKHRHQQENDDDDAPITPRRKRRLTQDEKDELADELNDLRSSSPEPSARTRRGTQSVEKTARGAALERLKRRRSGKPADPESEDEEEADGEGAEDSEEDEEAYDEDQRPMSSARFFQEDEQDADFIEEGEGDDAPLGIPDGLPLEFTRYASMRPKELFKYAVEWMVQKKINPAFQMTDPIYDLTFRKLNDETKGLVGSKFVSSVWTPQFANALRARPEMADAPIDRNSPEHFLRDTCDACNRTNHPATFQIQFQGKPYHPETLEEVAGNDDDDEEEDSDADSESLSGAAASNQPAYDHEGREVPPEARIFYIGKFCMSNAQTAHALQHWRYHLNEFVVTWLVRNGYDTPEAVVKRDKMSTKKRRKQANKIADRMEREGVIKGLWNDFRGNIDQARDAKQGRWG